MWESAFWEECCLQGWLKCFCAEPTTCTCNYFQWALTVTTVERPSEGCVYSDSDITKDFLYKVILLAMEEKLFRH